MSEPPEIAGLGTAETGADPSVISAALGREDSSELVDGFVGTPGFEITEEDT